jgi:hypothetical protein
VGWIGWSHIRSGLTRSAALLLGMFIAATAAFLPARAMRRLPTADVLAEE